MASERWQVELSDQETKAYKNVLQRGGQAFGEIERALPMVRDYIRRKGLILYGGMAIDFALRAAGREGIYPPGTVPDYDVFTPRAYEDSNELALILYGAGMKGAQAINAMHITTRRVRIQFEAVADLSYLPPAIFERLPTVEYEGFRVVHPDFQRLDMHRAFCFPLEKPPGEVIQQRLAKDIRRFPLLAAAYPLERARLEGASLTRKIGAKNGKAQEDNGGANGVWDGRKRWGGVQAPAAKGKAGELTISREWLKGAVLGGWAALAIYAAAAGEKGARCEISEGAIRVEMSGWGRPTVHLLTDDCDRFEGVGRTDKGNRTYYSRFLDNFYPRTLVTEVDGVTLEVADNLGALLPVVDLGEIPGMEAGRGVLVTAGQHVLLYMLMRAFQPPIAELQKEATADGDVVGAHLQAYETMCRLLVAAEQSDERAYLRMSLRTYGRANLSPDYMAAMAERLGRDYVKGVDLARPPFGFYPERGRTPEPFELLGKELFMIDGQRRERFVPLIPGCLPPEGTEGKQTGEQESKGKQGVKEVKEGKQERKEGVKEGKQGVKEIKEGQPGDIQKENRQGGQRRGKARV